MQNYIFLLPLYNDWKSAQKLIGEIDKQVKRLQKKADILIVDDNSTKKEKLNIKKYKNIKRLKIIELKKNLGSQKAISIGLKYIKYLNIKSIITILDSDGEDDFTKIEEMIKTAKKHHKHIVVSCRTERGEGFIFSLLYSLHKILTFIFTLKWIDFGNYSSFNSINLNKILKNNSTWLAYSSALAKNCSLKKVYAARKERFYGKSKLSSFGLILHSLRVISVFLPRVIVLSVIYIFCLWLFFYNVWIVYFFSLLSLIILLNIFVIVVRLIMKCTELNNYLKLIKK